MTIESKLRIMNEDEGWWLKSIPKPIAWTDINIVRFLRLYKSTPILWNIKNREYRNESSRLSAFKNIAENLKLETVDGDSCKKLVEDLKKRYIQEKKRLKNQKNRRPIWFDLLHSIIKEALNSIKTFDGYSEVSTDTSFADCKDCCEKQNLIPPCGYYHKEDDKSESCKESICKDDKSSQEEKEKSDNAILMCHTITKGNMDEVTKDFNKCFEQIYQLICIDVGKPDDETDNSTEESSICPCDLQSSTESSEHSDCLCNMVKKTNSGSSDKNFCAKDFSLYRIGKAPRKVATSDDSVELAPKEKAGLFIDPERFAGKRASLVDEYLYDDRTGNVELIEPRRHFAACNYDPSEIYPLQLEM